MLSDNCKYFKALFDFPTTGESKQESSSVRLEDVTPETLEDVLDILKDPTDEALQPEKFRPRSSYFEILGAAAFLGRNSIALLKSQQAFQQTIQQSFQHYRVYHTTIKTLLKSLLRFQQSY